MPKNKAAQELGRRGGKARAKSLTKERRSEIARMGFLARWRKQHLPILKKSLDALNKPVEEK